MPEFQKVVLSLCKILELCLLTTVMLRLALCVSSVLGSAALGIQPGSMTPTSPAPAKSSQPVSHPWFFQRGVALNKFETSWHSIPSIWLANPFRLVGKVRMAQGWNVILIRVMLKWDSWRVHSLAYGSWARFVASKYSQLDVWRHECFQISRSNWSCLTVLAPFITTALTLPRGARVQRTVCTKAWHASAMC